MAILTREQILQADDLPRETVPVPEWGGEVIVRTMGGTEQDAFEASLVVFKGKGRKRTAERDMKNYTAKLVSLVVCDEKGKPLFNQMDVQALGRKSTAALARVVEVAMRLNGIRDEDVEEAEKNSESAPSDDGTSSSQEPSSDAP